MNDLTEQWKKGKLPSGWYYVKNEFGNIFPSDYSEDYDCISDTVIKDFFTEVSEIKEVLEPVPSYDELQNMNEAVNECMGANIKLVEQNAQLKEQINKYYLDVINRGTANAVKAVKEFGMPERIKELVEKNTQLKELLKECELWFTGMVGNMNDKNVGEHNKSVPIGNFEYIFKEFSQKIKGALK